MSGRAVCLAAAGAFVAVSLVRRRRRRRQKAPSAPKRLEFPPVAKPEGPKSDSTCASSLAQEAKLLLLSFIFSAGIVLLFDSARSAEPFDSLQRPGSHFLIGLVLTLVTLFAYALRFFERRPRSSAIPKEPLVHTDEIADFSGVWDKDASRSTKPDAVFQLMETGPLLRAAVVLVRGLEIRQDATTFNLTVVSVLSIIKVSERYALDGAPSQWRRRDLRRGCQTGRLRWDAQTQQLALQLSWPRPLAGTAHDTFSLLSPTELLVKSVLCVAGKTATYDTLYTRRSP